VSTGDSERVAASVADILPENISQLNPVRSF
jgi:hypothetical protein